MVLVFLDDFFSNNEFYGDISRLMEQNNNSPSVKFGEPLMQDVAGKMLRFNRENDIHKVFQEDEFIVRDPDERYGRDFSATSFRALHMV